MTGPSAPMSGKVRDSLVAIVAKDPEIWQEPKRLRGLLADYCPLNRRETIVLVLSAESRIPHDIATSSAGLPWEVTAARLARKLEDETAISSQAARWAVDTWGIVLGKVSATTASNQPVHAPVSPNPPLLGNPPVSVAASDLDELVRANTALWARSGEAEAWVRQKKGKWQFSDEQQLLESLRNSAYWPLDVGELPRALELARWNYEANLKLANQISIIMLLFLLTLLLCIFWK